MVLSRGSAQPRCHRRPVARFSSRFSGRVSLYCRVLLSAAFVLFAPLSVRPVCAQNAPPVTNQQGRGTISELGQQRIREHIRRGLDLVERQAVYSAQQEFTKALRLTAGELDLAAGTHDHQAAVDAGLRAFDSVDYIKRNAPPANASAGTDRSAPGMSAIMNLAAPDLSAIQRRLVEAQDQLVSAVGHEPAGSLALYLLGRSQIATAGDTAEEKALAAPKAIALFQAALAVDPGDYLAANELGVTLARYGQLDEAYRALAHGASLTPRPEILRNLTIVCERMGNIQGAQQARAQYNALVATRQGCAPNSESPQARAFAASVRWVDPPEFVQCSGAEFDDLPAKDAAQTSPQQTVSPKQIVPPTPAAKQDGGLSLPNWMASGLKNLQWKSGSGENR
jgi:hypothetical protein